MWCAGQPLLQAFTMIQLETLEFGTERVVTMRKVQRDHDVHAEIGQINESRDNRFAVIGCNLFTVESYYGLDGKQIHIGSVFEATDVYNACDAGLLDEEVRDPANHLESWAFDTNQEAEFWFLTQITKRLGEMA
jgi:hypothetical protein